MHVEIALAQIIGTLSKKIGDKMTIEERYDRIDSAPYVIFQDDKLFPNTTRKYINHRYLNYICQIYGCGFIRNAL